MIAPSVVDHDVNMDMILKWNFNLISFPARKGLRLNEEHCLEVGIKGYMFLLFIFSFRNQKGKELSLYLIHRITQQLSSHNKLKNSLIYHTTPCLFLEDRNTNLARCRRKYLTFLFIYLFIFYQLLE